LISKPILQPIDPNKDLVINTDASCTGGYSYVLMQLGDDNKVSYGAQACTKAQTRYTPAELELIAVILALKAYECFAINKNVTILTDNTRVLHLDRWPAVNARQRRMLTYLMQFRLTIKFIRECKNYSADALSRIFEDMSEEQKKEFLPAPDSQEFIVAVSDNIKKEYYPYIYLYKPTETRLKAVEENDTTLNDAIRIRDLPLQNMDDRTERPGLRQSDSCPMLVECTAVTQHSMQTRSRSHADVARDTTDDPRDDGADTNNNSECRIQDGDIVQQTLHITDKDYIEDEEFQDIFRYLTTGGLTGNDKKNKVTLLIADQYFVKDVRLYRLSIPRNKRVARMRLLAERLCIPRKFRYDLLAYHHNNLGHFGIQRLFLSLSQKV